MIKGRPKTTGSVYIAGLFERNQSLAKIKIIQCGPFVSLYFAYIFTMGERTSLSVVGLLDAQIKHGLTFRMLVGSPLWSDPA